LHQKGFRACTNPAADASATGTTSVVLPIAMRAIPDAELLSCLQDWTIMASPWSKRLPEPRRPSEPPIPVETLAEQRASERARDPKRMPGATPS
jgi:hypothetical protein